MSIPEAEGRVMGGTGVDFRRMVNRHANLLQLLALTVLIFAAMAALNPDKFLRPYNFISITFVAPELGLLAIAMMLAMLTGGIDLSVIGIANLSGILAGLFFHMVGAPRGPALLGLPLPLVAAGVAIALGTGLLAGALNGWLITRARITPILATIGSGQIFVGLSLVLTGGPAIVGFPKLWDAIGNSTVLGAALPAVLFVAVAAAVALVLTRTPLGVNLFLIGTSAKAARFAGIRLDRAIFLSYVATGALASVAGILLSSRTNAAKSDYGTSYLLQAVLIAVLGGTNPAGGRATVLGLFIALVALMFLSSGFQLMRFSNFLVDFIWGAFLLLVIAINALRNRAR
jgi:simple sugar transport system permease protein